MGDMGSGGAPRIKSIIAHLTTIAGSVVNGLMKTSLHRGDGTEIGTAANPIHVDIGGNVPDTVGIAQVGGADVAVGAGVADLGTMRVAVASDDANLVAIKTATATSAAQADVVLSTRASEVTLGAVSTTVGTLAKEAGGNLEAVKTAIETANANLATLETDVESVLAQVDAKTSTLAKETGGNLDAIKTAVTTSATNADVLLSTRATETTLAAIKARADAAAAPVKTAATGSGAVSVSYAPAKAFCLDAVTVHFSAAPTAVGDLTVTLDAVDGVEYDTVLFRVDPSTDSGATDIVFAPLVPIPCVEGDAISVTYANVDLLTHGVRIMAREV